MPTLHLAYAPMTRQPSHAQLAQAITALTGQHLRKRTDLTQVHIQRVDPADWFVGAEAAAHIGRAGYRLSIDVSAGSNTDAEMAQYIAAVHNAMAELLGPVIPASYVLVQTLPMSQWGWSGRTQAERATQADLQLSN